MQLDFTAPPTVAKFMRSQAFGRLIAGPVGSGKTTGCIFEIFRRACEQQKAPDGLRYTRFAILRQTLSQLKTTVLKDILAFFGPISQWKVSDSTIFIEAGEVRCELILIPLEDIEDQRRLLSMQLTSAFISEAIEINIDLVPAIAGRCGRYPSAAQGGCTHFGIIADTNMPAEATKWHKFMTEPPPDWEIFIQPGGLEEVAENLNWLTQTAETLKLPIDHPDRLAQGRKYYERLSRSNSPDWVRRYVHAQFGDDPSGTAVFRESFKSAFHCVDSLEPVAGHPLLVGQDFGRDPCTIICQVDHRGRLLVLEEVIAEDIGLEMHIERAVRPVLMHARYMGKPVAMIGDPAGTAKSSLSEETSFDALNRLGFAAFPAPTNDIDPRIRAVESWLLKQFDGRGAILIDRTRCPELTRALSGGYRYAKTKLGVRKPKPDKSHPYSDIVDALQYVCMVAQGRMGDLVARHMARRRRTRPTQGGQSAAGWT
jgi:hypothetical protein